MKRFIQTIQRESGLARGEAIVVSGVLSLLIIGWVGKSFSSDTATHNVEQADKVIELLDSIMRQPPTNQHIKPGQAAGVVSPQKNPPSNASKNVFKRVVVPLNINTASVSMLERLPGVGPATAQKIVETRMERPFASVDEITRVRGIGPAKLEKMRPYITAP